jgi:uncharacterized protein (DUF305 family)
MKSLTRRGSAFALLAAAMLVAPVPSALAQNPMPGMGDMPGMDMNLPPVKIPAGADYTTTDVRFMQGMIGHHGQAVYMTSLAKAHGASDRLLTLAQKISQSQIAEIALMQGWLRANGQFAPDSSAWRHMMMPGMLTADQLAQLDTAHGREFDRLFLTFMIQHHEGALKMVQDLFAAPLAGQDIDVSVFANDVHTVQTAEIGIMQRMLNTL